MTISRYRCPTCGEVKAEYKLDYLREQWGRLRPYQIALDLRVARETVSRWARKLNLPRHPMRNNPPWERRK